MFHKHECCRLNVRVCLKSNAPITHFVGVSSNITSFCPVEVGGRDDFLGIGGEAAQNGPSSGFIEFSKNVVDQEKRGRTFLLFDNSGLSDFERQCEGALLTLGSEGVRPPVMNL